MYFRINFSRLALLLFFALSSCNTEKGTENNVIKKKTEEYIKTYNQHDPKAIAAFWAEDASYTNPETGEVIEGRAAIEEAFQKHFKDKGEGQLEVKIGSIIFPSSKEAIETGSFTLKVPGQEPKKSGYKFFFKKQNRDWVISKVREIGIAAVPDHYQHLKELEWLIGEWVDKDEDVNIDISYRWNESKNYIIQKFSITTEGELEQQGRQIILWDPIMKKIRSWIFDSDGGFGESTWSKRGDSWVVEITQTLADGTRASAINTFKPLDKNSYSWESTGREVGGQLLPAIEPVIVQRK